MRAGRQAAVLALVLLCRCIPDVVVPAGLRCDEGVNRCPEGLVCNRLHRCVPEENLDLEAPQLVGAPAVTPAYGGRGQTFRVVFEVSKPLGGAPRVTAEAHGSTLEFALDAAASTATHVESTYTATGEEREGSATLYVDLQDQAGNPLVGPLGLSIELDFQPPLLTPSISPARARLDALVVITLTANEDLAAPPDIQVAPAGFALGSATPAGRAYTWTRRVQAGDPRGPFTLTAGAVDRAGNSDLFAIGAVEVDSVPPEADAVSVGPGAPVASGAVVNVVFTASEALARAAVRLEGDGMSCAQPSELVYACQRMVVGAPGEDGVRRILAELEDTFGNIALKTLGQVTTDFTAPGIGSFLASPSPAGLGTVLALALTPTEPLSAVRILAPPGFVLAGPAQAGLTTTWTHRVESSDPAFPAIAFDLVDLAGNRADGATAAPGPWIDVTAPSATLAPPLPPQMVKLGDLVELRLAASEPLMADPLVSLGPVPFARADGATDPYLFRHAFAEGDAEGPAQRFTVSLRDVAGNASSAAVGEPVRVDLTPPSATAVVSPDLARLGQTVRVAVTATELLAGPPILRSLPEREFAYAGRQGSTYSYERAVRASDPEGPYSFWAEGLTDTAGNVAAEVPLQASLRVDAIAPSLRSWTVCAGREQAIWCTPLSLHARSGTRLTVALTVSEPLADEPEVRLGTAAFELLSADGQSYSFERAIDCPSVPCTGFREGELEVTATLLDEAGNVDFESLGSVTVDLTPPDAVSDSVSVTLLAAGDNILRARGSPVSAVGVGTRVQVAFTATEILGPDPVVETSAPERLAFQWASSAGPSYLYDFTLLDDTRPQGPYTLAATLTDPAGNSDTVILADPAFSVDTVKPPPPQVETPDRVLYRRRPFGDQKSFTVEGGAGSAEAGALVLVYDGGNVGTASQIGAREASSDGSIPAVPLARADRAVVYVAAADGAGNLSEAAAVRDVEWTATLGGKVPGSTLENPTTFTTVPYLREALIQDPVTEREPGAGELERLQTQDGASLEVAAQQRWQERTPTGVTPGALSIPRLAYDAGRGRVVLFGAGFQTGNDIWEWEGDPGRWIDRTLPGTKPEIGWGALLYDAARGKVITAAYSADVGYRDLWEWDGTGGAWTRRTPSPLPADWPLSMDSTAAYDSARRKVVLYLATRRETWEWDPASGGWANRTPGTLPASWPPAMTGAAATYDSGREKVILLSGRDYPSDQFLNELWEWDGAAGTWTRRPGWGIGTGPAERDNHALAYDSRRGKMVLFGGRRVVGGSSFPFNDLWEWDGASGAWTSRTPSLLPATWPGMTYGNALAYDQARARVVLFSAGQTWEWDPETGLWADRTPSAANPEKRQFHAMAYDSRRSRAVLFGGHAPSANVPAATWEWDMAGRWTLASTSGPERRYWQGMTYDQARGTVVLFGGLGQYSPYFRTDLWEWDGASWTERLPPEPTPPARYGHSLVYDPPSGRSLLFAGKDEVGYYLRDLWSWDPAGDAWSELTPSPIPVAWPGGRYLHRSVYDSARARHVVYGGEGGYQDLWEWDGATGVWANRAPSPLPAVWPGPRSDHAMTYDPLRRKVLLLGGSGGTPRFDVWEWDGAAGRWADRTPSAGSLPGRLGAAMVFDLARGRAVVFGGTSSTGQLQDLWEWEGGARERPAALWRVPWIAAAEPEAAPARLAVVVHAGGRGFTMGEAASEVEGADLLVWDTHPGKWRRVDQNQIGPSVMAGLAWSTSDPVTIQRLMFGPQKTITVAVAPSAANGSGAELARVAVDHVELSIRYHRR